MSAGNRRRSEGAPAGMPGDVEAIPLRPGGWKAAFLRDLVVILFALPVLLPLVGSGWPIGHDDLHLIRLFEQDVVLRDGAFPPRWYPDVVGGYGSPHPEFYAPLFYWISQIFLFAGASLDGALKAGAAVVIAGGALAMRRLVAADLGERAAIVAAVAVTYAPYHHLDLFVRTAFSEMTVFLVLPVALLAFRRLADSPSPRRIAWAAAATAAAALAHTISVMLLPVLLGSWILILAWRSPRRSAFLGSAAAASLLGAGLAAFFILPLAMESGAIDTRVYTLSFFDYHKHFVQPLQLVWSSWGFGQSREGSGDGIAFRLGLLHLLGVAVLCARWRSVRGRWPGAEPLLVYAAALSAVGILMALPASAPIWSLVPPLKFVQFPWRFLMLPAMGLSILAGAGAASLIEGVAGRRAARRRADGSGASRRSRAVLPPAALVASGLFVAASVGMIGFSERVPMEAVGYGGDHAILKPRDPADVEREPTVFTRPWVRSQTLRWFDHVPLGVTTYPSPSELTRPRAVVERGQAVVEVAHERPTRWTLRVDAREPSLVRLGVHSFPGWSVTIDGAAAPLVTQAGPRPLLRVEVPPGTHEVVFSYGSTAPRRAGDLISLISILIAAAFAVPWRGRKRHDEDPEASRQEASAPDRTR
jgi:hypothetical protein